jgi:hypothetical protein
MRWACPHCKCSLETSFEQAPQSDGAAGPRLGWAYVRCFQCDQFSEVETATGSSNPILLKKKTAVPPPFPHAAPLAPQTLVPQTPAPTPVHAQHAFPAFDDYLKTSLDFSPSPELRPPTRVTLPRPLIGSRFSMLLTGTGLLLVASGSLMIWTARHSAAPAAQIASATQTAQTAFTPLERARTAARRVTPQPAAAQPAPARLAAATELNDSISSHAMAPRRPRPDDIQLYLQARKSTRAMELRTGPGTGYALLGLADLEERYPVIEVKDRWFRIQLEETPGLTAWVAYERVELFSQDKEPEDLL